MKHYINEDGNLEELDVKLVSTSNHALLKVNNPPSSRVAKTRPHSSVLGLIRKRGEEQKVFIKTRGQ